MSWAEDEGIDAYDEEDFYLKRRKKRKPFIADEDDFEAIDDAENE